MVFIRKRKLVRYEALLFQHDILQILYIMPNFMSRINDRRAPYEIFFLRNN